MRGGKTNFRQRNKVLGYLFKVRVLTLLIILSASALDLLIHYNVLNFNVTSTRQYLERYSNKKLSNGESIYTPRRRFNRLIDLTVSA